MNKLHSLFTNAFAALFAKSINVKPHELPHSVGTFNVGRNAQKRRERAKVAALKGVPGGWKKAARKAG